MKAGACGSALTRGSWGSQRWVVFRGTNGNWENHDTETLNKHAKQICEKGKGGGGGVREQRGSPVTRGSGSPWGQTSWRSCNA